MKVVKDLNQGPAREFGMEGAPEPGLYTGYASMIDILERLENVHSPSFRKMQSQVVELLDIKVPEDPMDIGLKEMKILLARVADRYRTLVIHRTECVAIKSEWTSLRTDFNRHYAKEVREHKQSEGIKECKNDKEREAYIAEQMEHCGWASSLSEQAIQRCNDFIETCRIVGKGLDAASAALGRQLEIIKVQANVSGISPDEL